MKSFITFALIIFISSSTLKADEVSSWLKIEIDKILNAYKNESLSGYDKFELIEDTINQNFASVGIGKFVVASAWSSANKDTKKNYIHLFKRHLALSIASMMQAYSNQEYELSNANYDNKNKVNMIDMEIKYGTGNLLVTWRVKESKGRFFVIDLLVADISLVVTKRDEFNSMLKKVDYDLGEFNKILSSQNEYSYNKMLKK